MEQAAACPPGHSGWRSKLHAHPASWENAWLKNKGSITGGRLAKLLRFDLDDENESVPHCRERLRQCEELGEFALAEQVREILMQEQDRQIDLATALGEEVLNLSSPRN